MLDHRAGLWLLWRHVPAQVSGLRIPVLRGHQDLLPDTRIRVLSLLLVVVLRICSNLDHADRSVVCIRLGPHPVVAARRSPGRRVPPRGNAAKS